MREYKTRNMEFIDRVEQKNIMLRKKGLRGCARKIKSNYTNDFLLKYIKGFKVRGIS